MPNKAFVADRKKPRPLKSNIRHKNQKGGFMEPDKIMDGLSKEINLALTAMAKAKDVNEKEAHSRIVKNLCESLGVFLNLASEIMPFDDADV